MAEVTGPQLAGAIETVRLNMGDPDAIGGLSSEALARRLMGALPPGAPEAADPELAAMAAIVAALDGIATGDSDEDGRAIRRIVRYLCDRYGTDD